jgi:hypothetical protein
MEKHFSNLGIGLLIFIFLVTSCDQISSFEDDDLSLEQIQKIEDGFHLERIKNGLENEGKRFSEPTGVIKSDATACQNGECFVYLENGERTMGEFNFNESFSSQAVSGYLNGNIQLEYIVNNLAYFSINYGSFLTTSSGERPEVYVTGTFLGTFNDSGSKFGTTSYELEPAGDGPDFYYSEADQSSMFDYSEVECGDSFTFSIVLSISGEEFIFSKEYFLIPICSESCDEETFSYTLNPLENESVDLRFSYNYKNEADLTLEFEFSQLELDDPKAKSYIGADGKVYMISKDKKSKTLTWTGSIGCSVDDPTTFDFAGLLPECKGNGVNNKTRAIWKDTRVVAIDGVPLVDLAETPEYEGPYSLKGDLEDIELVGCN